MNGTSILTKETSEGFLTLLPHEDRVKSCQSAALKMVTTSPQNQVKLEDSFPKWIADIAGKLVVVKRPQFFATWPSSFDLCILTVWHLA